MKLLRFGQPGTEKPGLQLEDGTRIDVSGFGMDWNHEFFADPKQQNLWNRNELQQN